MDFMINACFDCLRIVNGRYVEDSVGSATFFCSRENSLINYVLAKSNEFDSITEF
jgi:hypothetical protein